jgi:hypothetical protein
MFTGVTHTRQAEHILYCLSFGLHCRRCHFGALRPAAVSVEYQYSKQLELDHRTRTVYPLLSIHGCFLISELLSGVSAYFRTYNHDIRALLLKKQ